MHRLALIGTAVIAALSLSLTGEAVADARLDQAAQHFADLEDDEARAILEELSAEGIADADVLLGYLHSDPLYEGRDYEKAVNAFERAAASGNEEAVFQLAEARFWPDYSDWRLTPDEKVARPSAEDAFGLLLRASSRQNYAARWRLAHLCFFGGYDCDAESADKALTGVTRSLVLGNIRTIVGVFRMIEIQRSGEADTPENAKTLKAYLALGMAAADPFVAALVTDSAWRSFGNAVHCPDPVSLEAAGRLLALEGNAVLEPDGWLKFRRCFDPRDLAAVREDLVASLDKLARAHGNEDSWHLQTCYQDPEALTFGDCIIHAVRHHYFACTKLSMIDYFRHRFDIYYANSARYQRCREHMLGARGR